MIAEIGILHVTPGEEGEFEAGFAQARHIAEGAAGCNKVELRRCLDKPSDYALIVLWDSVDHHVDFTRTESFQTFLRHIDGFMAEPGAVFHYGEPL